MLARVGFGGVELGPLSARTRIDREYRPPGEPEDGSSLLFASKAASSALRDRARTAVTVQPSFASLAVAPEYAPLTRCIPEDLREAVREVLPFVAQVNVAFEPFFAQARPELRQYLEREGALAALVAAALDARAAAAADHLYFLKQKHLFRKDTAPAAQAPAIANPDQLEAHALSWPKILARAGPRAPLAFLLRLQQAGFDGLLLSADSPEEAEALLRALKKSPGTAPGPALEYQVETRVTTREEVDRLHRAGFARVYLPQDCLLQQVRPAHQGPYRVREFLQTGQPLN